MKFLKISFYCFPFLIFSLFECRTNSLIYSVEQFLETYFHKNYWREKENHFEKKIVNFMGLFPPYLRWGVYYMSNRGAKRRSKNLNKQKLFRDWHFFNRFLYCFNKSWKKVKLTTYRKPKVVQKQYINKEEAMEWFQSELGGTLWK